MVEEDGEGSAPKNFLTVSDLRRAGRAPKLLWMLAATLGGCFATTWFWSSQFSKHLTPQQIREILCDPRSSPQAISSALGYSRVEMERYADAIRRHLGAAGKPGRDAEIVIKKVIERLEGR
jgi:hypothetical protein